jgi:hypothetical protein
MPRGPAPRRVWNRIPLSKHRSDALRRVDAVEGHVKIRNQDFDFQNSRLRSKGTGEEATQPMRKRRRSPAPMRPCPEAPMRPCSAARGGSCQDSKSESRFGFSKFETAVEGNGKRGNTTDADLEEEAESATEAPLRLLRKRTLPCGA